VVYSTCSLEKEENSQVVERVVGEDSSVRIVDVGTEMRRLQREGEVEAEEIVSGPYLRTVPGIQPCDGFFAAILEKAL
jgi:16S rRNA (cytosine967-C5)-methyltransferase